MNAEQTASYHRHLEGQRFGEADHPGPDMWIGTSNPSGLRGKEESYFTLPPGLWGVSESHLTALNQRDVDGRFRRLSQEYKRYLHACHGAPVARRSASSDTGTWAGVSVITDMPCRTLRLPWPQSEFGLGRAHMLQAWYGPFMLTGVNLYGWPKSPTWPRSAEANEAMLSYIVQELGLSRTGPRFLMGDFNCNLELSPSVNILDHVLVSPELGQFLQDVQSWNLFSDHTTIGARLAVPVRQIEHLTWPLPAYVPYNHVNMQKWHHAAQSYQPDNTGSIDDKFQRFCIAFEDSFTGCIQAPSEQLPPAARGRGQRTAPEKRPQQCPVLRPSRPGEVQQSSELLGRTVHKWFLQLRRLQSMKHALNAGKQTWDAQIYRAEAHQRNGLQHLEERWQTSVLSISEDKQQIHVEHDLPCDDTCVVEADGQQLVVQTIDGPVWTFQEPIEEEIHEVQVTKHHSTVEQIQQHLAQFWEKRWWKAPPSSSDWDRIFEFCRVYIPERAEEHEDITVSQWHEINKRYGKTAARGPDGFARRDLQWMPEPFQQHLVDQLNDWEKHGQFPQALCTGFVHPLPKRDDSILVGDFRPVIIYSMIYRSWSSLRARQLLKQLKTLSGQHQFGFLPQKENTEIWLVLQAWIEEATLQSVPLAGFVSDIEKAFECLPRKPLMWLAARLGISKNILQLWDYFLQTMVRRFCLSNQIGPPLISNSGYPEGCGLSCAAMAITNLVFHQYMLIYTKVTSLSFVDNLELLQGDCQQLHAGIMAMEAWADMWCLKLDKNKSYLWANDAALRNQCKQLGWDIKTHARDLGAPMTYGKRHSVVDQMERINSLQPLWCLLRRLTGTIWMKQRILFQAFWPRAFYGSAICCMSWQHVRHLRTEAMRALKFNRGGANPGVRLAILCPPQTDPGFYHCWYVIQTFKRISVKQPGFVQLWYSYMNKYQGLASYGPFGKLLEICGQIGWRVEPPLIYDHDGVPFNLLTVDMKYLEDLAVDAWRQGVAYSFADRKDVIGLVGVDWRAIHKIFQGMPAFQREALHVLQDGTFMEPKQHKKYDLTNTGLCRFCKQEDTMSHRCRACPARRELYQKHPQVQELWDSLSPALTLRLLPSRNDWEREFKMKLHQSEPKCISLKHLSGKPHLDLFTDGSCLDTNTPWASVGAWAIVSATHDRLVAKGTLGGVRQTSDRAELTAIKIAIDYAIVNAGLTTLWSDNAYVVEGVQRLLDNPMDLPRDQHKDLWEQIQNSLHGQGERISVQHVAAHRGTHRIANDVDDWTAHWNARVDHEAQTAHQLRDYDLEILRQKLLQAFHRNVRNLRLFAAFHFDLAEFQAKEVEYVDNEQEENTPAEGDGLDLRRVCESDVVWQRDLPEHFEADWRATNLAEQFGTEFTKSMIGWLKGMASSEHVVVFKMSYLEIAIWICSGEVTTKLPQPDSIKKMHWVSPQSVPAAEVSRPTIAAALKLTQCFFAALDRHFDFGLQTTDRLDLTGLGVTRPQKGLALLLASDTVKRIGQLLANLTKHRPIRSACDMARPLN
eukprot:s200_g50.t1